MLRVIIYILGRTHMEIQYSFQINIKFMVLEVRDISFLEGDTK